MPIATTCSTSRRSRTPSTTSCSSELQALEAQHPELLTPDSPTQRVGGKVAATASAGAPQGADAVASAPRPTSRRAARATFDARVRRELRPGRGRSAGRVRGRAQVRRPGHQPALRERRAGAGGDARRRRDRRGRDAEHPHHRPDPAAAAPAMRRAGAGGARRGLHAARRLRGAQRAPARDDRGGREEREDLRQSAQRGGRRGAPARPGDRARSGRSASSPMARARCRAGSVPADARARCSTRCAGMGLAGLAGARGRRRARRAGRLPPARRREARQLPFDIDGVVYKVNSARAAAAARLRLARAALGRRAQVPGAGAAHHGARHRRAGRPHRQADAGRQAGAGVRRRHHGQQRHPAQRGRGAPQGRARRRHRDRAPRRRRDPRGGRRRASSGAGRGGRTVRPYAASAATARSAAARSRARRARSTSAASAACSARRSASRPSCISRSGARSTSRAWATSSSTSWSTAAWSARCPTSTSSASPSWSRSSAWPRRARRTCSSGLEKQQADHARALPLRPGHPPRRRDHREGPGAHFGTLDAIMDARVEQLLEVPDVGPIVAQSIHTFFDQPHNREVVEQLRAGGVTWPRARGPAARSRRRAAGRQDLRADRHAADAEPRRGQGHDRGGRRQGRRLGLEEDRLRGGGQPRPAASSTRRRSSASPCSTRPACWNCWPPPNAADDPMATTRPMTARTRHSRPGSVSFASARTSRRCGLASRSRSDPAGSRWSARSSRCSPARWRPPACRCARSAPAGASPNRPMNRWRSVARWLDANQPRQPLAQRAARGHRPARRPARCHRAGGRAAARHHDARRPPGRLDARRRGLGPAARARQGDRPGTLGHDDGRARDGRRIDRGDARPRDRGGGRPGGRSARTGHQCRPHHDPPAGQRRLHDRAHRGLRGGRSARARAGQSRWRGRSLRSPDAGRH